MGILRNVTETDICSFVLMKNMRESLIESNFSFFFFFFCHKVNIKYVYYYKYMKNGINTEVDVPLERTLNIQNATALMDPFSSIVVIITNLTHD